MNWIRDFVDLDGQDIDALIHRFTLSTAEVEEVFHYGDNTSNVVVAQIVSIENHPNSKKLHLLKVDAGDKVYDCVCGAPNVREGMKVAFAKEGGSVNGFAISKATVAGYDSYGMCCSEAELGISADNSGIMEITDDIPLGTDLKSVYAIEDTVFEVDNKSLTNRPDLWGHYGIAREFAALTGNPLKPIDRVDTSVYSELPPVDIDIQDPEHCYRYSGMKVENINVHQSPVNMRIRLFYCGSRAINLLADLTNYLMMEVGQPMHAFDRRKVDCVEIKRFDAPFTFKTLDDNERNIDENTLMICSKGEPVAIAGIMGGLDSEIEDDTTSLLLESANFDGVCIRKSSQRLGLRTDASMRYEKMLDPEITTVAIERFLKLLMDIDPGVEVISSLSDSYPHHYDKIELTFDKAYVDRYTGIEISDEQIIDTLTSLGFDVKHEGTTFYVTVPSWRATKDVTIKADIIEEITRIYGYDNFRITTTLSPLRPVRKSVGKSDEYYAKDLLVEKFTLHEVHSYIWADYRKFGELNMDVEDNVKLLNSINPDHVVLRNCMVPTLLTVVSENKSFGAEYGVFEIARVIDGTREDGACNERKKLGIVLYSRKCGEKELFFRLRDIVSLFVANLRHKAVTFEHTEANHNWQHPVNTASVSVDGVNLGFISALHPLTAMKIDKKAAIVCAEIDMDDFAGIAKDELDFTEPSKFPGIDIDLTIIRNPDVTYSKVEEIIKDNGGQYLNTVTVTDTYDGLISSITLRLAFSSPEKTLSMTEIQEVVFGTIVPELEKSGVLLKM
jgi:phenylalanyl-tRNA synthetase, beta subunit, non-spirochete bacterial